MPCSFQMVIEDNGNEVFIKDLTRELAVAGKQESLPFLQTVCIPPWGLWEMEGSSHGEVWGGRAYGNPATEDLVIGAPLKRINRQLHDKMVIIKICSYLWNSSLLHLMKYS